MIGVLPQNFEFAPRGRAEFWTALQPNRPCETRRSCHNLTGVARLKDRAPIQTALANTQAIAQQLEKQYPDSNRGQGASVLPLSEVIVGNVRLILLMLLGGAGLLFVIACVNVSSLLLVRSEGRLKEIAVRGALGATPARLIRQFVTEGLVLVAAGSLFGLVSAYELINILLQLISKNLMYNLPFLRGLSLNLHVLVFAGGISLVAAFLFSITPIARARFSKLHEALADSGRGFAGIAWRRLGSNLVVVELAIAMVLLVGAGLLSKSLYRLLHVELGFQSDHLATMDIIVPQARYGDATQAVALERQVIGRVSSLPGVKSVAICNILPVNHNGNTDWIRFVGKLYNGEHNEANARDVSAEYFTTLQAKLLRGRYFTDYEDSRNQAWSSSTRPWPDNIFLEKTQSVKSSATPAFPPALFEKFFGVVDDIRKAGSRFGYLADGLLPLQPIYDSSFSLLVRTAQDEKFILPALMATVRQIDPEIGTVNQSTMKSEHQ